MRAYGRIAAAPWAWVAEPPGPSHVSIGRVMACGCAEGAHAEHGHGHGGAAQAGEAPVVDDYRALLAGTEGDWLRWNDDGGSAAVGLTFVTYSFREAGDLPSLGELHHGATSAHSFSSAQRTVARDALARWDDASGLVFVEVERGGMIDFYGVRGSDVGGYSFYPPRGRTQDEGGTVVDLDPYDASSATWRSHVLTHEIGHRLGLSHPHEGAFVLDPAIDSRSRTIMSYEGTYTGLIGDIDRAAITYLYGADMDPAASGVTYAWNGATARLTVTGGAGDDILSGASASNALAGGAGNDRLVGGGGDDTLSGGAGNDTLSGSGGDDLLEGGDGADLLRLGWGDATANGGTGDDRFEILGGASGVVIRGGPGTDSILVTDGNADLYFADIAGTEIVRGGAGADHARAASSVAMTYDLGGGDDTYVYGAAADTVRLGAGRDVVSFEGQFGALILDLGADAFTTLGGVSFGVTVTGAEGLRGGFGDDEVRGADGGETLEGYFGDDTLYGSAGSDLLMGGAGADLLYGDDPVDAFLS